MANKIKTRKAASKRFKVTKNGKVLHRSQKLRHLRSSKSARQIRRLKTVKRLNNTLSKKVKIMVGKA